MAIEPSLFFSFLFAELPVLSQILGHSSIKTTQIYAKITLKKLDWAHFFSKFASIWHL